MNDHCKQVVAHINRLQGQLNAFKSYIESNRKCGDVVHLAISTSKSFDSLKAKIVDGFIKQELLDGSKLSPKKAETLKKLMDIVKA